MRFSNFASLLLAAPSLIYSFPLTENALTDRARLAPINEVSKRATREFFDLRGNGPIRPMSGADQARINIALFNAITMARIAQRVPRGDALFLRFFGSSDHYDDVMNVFNRVENVLTNAVAGNINFARAGPPPADRQQALGVTGTEGIAFFDPFFTSLRDIVQVNAMPLDSPDFLSAFMVTRGSAMLHELVHFVSRGQMQNVIGAINGSPGNPPQPPIDPNGPVIDVTMEQLAVDASAVDEGVLIGLPAGTIAYGARNVLNLAQMARGPIAAALNADTYNAFASAALQNWRVSGHPPASSSSIPGLATATQTSVWSGVPTPADDPDLNLDRGGGIRSLIAWLSAVNIGHLKGDL